MIDLEKIAEDRGENPYYLAFAIEHGFDSSRKAFDHFGSNHPFMIWNDTRWRETMKRLGVSGIRTIPHKEHIKTLEDRLSKFEDFLNDL